MILTEREIEIKSNKQSEEDQASKKPLEEINNKLDLILKYIK